MTLSIFGSIFRIAQPISLFFISILFLSVPLNSQAFSTPFAASHSAQSAITPSEDITATAGQSRETVTDLSKSDEAALVPEKSLVSKQTLVHLQVSLEQFIQVLYWRLVAIEANSAKLPYDLAEAMDNLSFGNGTAGFFTMLGLIAVIFTVAAGTEFVFRRVVLSRFFWNDSPDSVSGWLRLWIIFLQIVPDVLALLFFVAASYVAYILIYPTHFSAICPLFLSLLAKISIVRCLLIICRIFINPRGNRLTLVSLNPQIAVRAYYKIAVGGWIIIFSILFVTLFHHAGVSGDSLLLLKLGFGAFFCLFITAIILLNRRVVSRFILGDADLQTVRGFRELLAGRWHLMALGYLLLLWILWAVRLIVSGSGYFIAFLVSLFIVPIFLLLDRLIIGFFRSLFNPEPLDGESADDTAEDKSTPSVLLHYLILVSRLLIVSLLGLWLLSLWGYPVAFSDTSLDRGREILFTLLVAFFVWKLIDLLIRNFLKNKELAQAAEEEDVDSEWGDAPLLDRSQTLLPVVRKFIGITMVVMTIMLILSALGVNIGPLLAGAGVVGIAIGFGAQKLVSDVLSGLFYLLDDAFRVGEYIEAGSITGAVEKITLRNVMLRHHRGMLQIVPYSDLGAITNFMRGGIVVKFNLQFPYDTDVDVVRKVIKRVGIAMLDDPEFGKNFIKQVKSQGIREVGDSILTIRVKFTAKPGTHFLIRREAYRRITDALAAKGIHYAHRKVIVEVPSIAGDTAADGQAQPLDDETKKRIAQAGAAAHQVQQQGKSDG